MKAWIVIEVKRGFIQEPEIFYNADKAERRMRELQRGYNPDYDELEMFEKQINVGRYMTRKQSGHQECNAIL